MPHSNVKVIEAGEPRRRSEVADRQAPLRKAYEADPGAAAVVDQGRTLGGSPGDPFHTTVVAGRGYENDLEIPVGIHRGVGGLHDMPNSGELLCAALASCQDTVLRMVAALLGVELTSLTVDVSARADLRGTLAVDRTVPVGFQDMHCRTRAGVAAGTDPRLVTLLQATAERSCVVLDTLRRAVEVTSSFEIEGSNIQATSSGTSDG